MHKLKIDFLVFAGGKCFADLPQIESSLPQNLSKYGLTICFEYPEFIRSLLMITKRTPLIEKVSDKFYIYYSIGILPFGRTFIVINFLNHLINYLMFRLFFRIDSKKTKIITLTPELYLLYFIFNKTSIIYYVIDNYKSLPWWRNYFQQKQFIFLDKKISKHASMILATSSLLFDKYMRLNKNTYLFRIPSNTDYYLNITRMKNNDIPSIMHGIKHPIIGYIGSIYEWKIDISLLFKLLKKFPRASFVFFGTIELSVNIRNTLESYDNYFYLNNIPPKDLSNYTKQIDVGVIPYKVDEYGKYAYPVKIMEYLILGKPVVTTSLLSIKYLADRDLIYWANNNEEFYNYLRIALEEQSRPELVKKRISEAKKNDWSIKINEFISIIQNSKRNE